MVWFKISCKWNLIESHGSYGSSNKQFYFDIFTGKHGNNKRKRELHIANESKFKIPATKFPVQMLSKKPGSCLVVSTGMRYMMWQCK